MSGFFLTYLLVGVETTPAVSEVSSSGWASYCGV
jgi:hypothetical protein